MPHRNGPLAAGHATAARRTLPSYGQMTGVCPGGGQAQAQGGLLPVPPSTGPPVNADDSARIRDLLASNRTLLAWIRTSIAFAGLGFVVAKFGFVIAQSGRTEDRIRFSGLLGIFLVLVGLLFTVMGYLQHHALLFKEKPPSGAPVPSRWPGTTAAACCTVACALLAAYLAATT